MNIIRKDGVYVYGEDTEPGVYIYSDDKTNACVIDEVGGITYFPLIVAEELERMDKAINGIRVLDEDKCNPHKDVKGVFTVPPDFCTDTPSAVDHIITLKSSGFSTQDIVDLADAGLIPK